MRTYEQSHKKKNSKRHETGNRETMAKIRNDATHYFAFHLKLIQSRTGMGPWVRGGNGDAEETHKDDVAPSDRNPFEFF